MPTVAEYWQILGSGLLFLGAVRQTLLTTRPYKPRVDLLKVHRKAAVRALPRWRVLQRYKAATRVRPYFMPVEKGWLTEWDQQASGWALVTVGAVTVMVSTIFVNIG